MDANGQKNTGNLPKSEDNAPPSKHDELNNTFNEADALKNLVADVRDQDDLERDITYQASVALIDADDKRDEKRIEKAQSNITRLEAQRKTQEERFRKAAGQPELKQKIRDAMAAIDSEIQLNNNDITQFQIRIQKRHEETQDVDQTSAGNRKLPGETYHEFLLRTGKITPFDVAARPKTGEGELADALADAEDEAAANELEEKAGYETRSHQHLRAPGFAEDTDVTTTTPIANEFSLRPRKRPRPERDDASSDYVDSAESEDYDLSERPSKKTKKEKASKKIKKEENEIEEEEQEKQVDISKLDDGIESNYQVRLTDWVDRRSRARQRRQEFGRRQEEQEEEVRQDQEEPEWFKPSPDEPDHNLAVAGLKLPGDIYPALFDYQKTGVEWLAKLYAEKVGGILGDEMGLGKTVQVISFIAALHYSQRLNKPVLVVAPATVLQQWVNEFHRWWPPLRVSMLHSSGSGMLNMSKENQLEDRDLTWNQRRGPRVVNKAAKRIIDRVVQQGHVLVTTYASIQVYGDLLATTTWGYVVLDEGHKIRNPNAAVTIACKDLLTPHRIILSGTPIQNNLAELWSLFDFVAPFRLGNLLDFRINFEVPIKMGGYANATHLQIMTAEKTAQTLKDTISRFLLQRLKVDVATDLPKKNEQTILCKLTKLQFEVYQLFLDSKEMNDVLKGNTLAFFGIDRLRKICNHPDLIDPDMKTRDPQSWGAAKKSGKMQVLHTLLREWKKLGHKTLLFTQTVQMLDILEHSIPKIGNIQYLRMDGKTAIKTRQGLVDKFNKDPNIDLFLLTTKVGGLGVNLTGANRVIIYDPDWNPSTDVQARERAWRLGQKQDVTIYRLITAGTIEEKIFHRQIFKQFLSNKVLKDPKHRTGFNFNDLHDLFTLGMPDKDAAGTETAKLFKDSVVDIPNTATSAATTGKLGNTAASGDEYMGRIDGIAGVEDYNGDGETKPAANEEDRIMQSLFARSGVHSVLEHDAIVDGKPRANRAVLQQEATRVANEAASMLRRAEREARNIPIGTVTWTGEVGEGGRPGRPSNIRRGQGGPASTSVLSNLSQRQGISRPTFESPRPDGGARQPMRLDDFLKAIPAFIKRHGGKVPTKAIVDHFNPLCKTNKQSIADFKMALERVAVSRPHGAHKLWALRDG